MPEKEEHTRIQSFEDALEKGLETRLVGVQVASVTGSGRKEWRYYTSNVEEFMGALNTNLKGHPPYPIDVRQFLDPEWGALKELQSENS